MRTKRARFVLVAVLAAACGGDGTAENAGTLESIDEATLELARFDLASERLIDADLPDELTIELSLVQGQLFGTPADGNLVELPIAAGRTEARFSEALFHGGLVPTEITATALARGLRIEPPSARFGRLGTFASSASADLSDVVGYGFYSELVDALFFIAYFDRAVVVSGVVGNERLEADFSVPEAGFYALAERDGRVVPVEVGRSFRFVLVMDGSSMVAARHVRANDEYTSLLCR